jgi:branched-chain amino acid transport system substrate-binding protein
VKDPGFLEAGEAAEGSVITCPCIPADDPAVAEFASAYEAEFGEAPGTYAAESYDAANIFLDGIAEGIDNREDMLAFINEYDEPGVTKQLKFDETGEPADVHVYAYTVQGGEIVPEGEIS